eukprot:4084620-Prymnesium_polylepis.1
MTSSSPRSGRQAEDVEVEATFSLADRKSGGGFYSLAKASQNMSVQLLRIPNSTRAGAPKR